LNEDLAGGHASLLPVASQVSTGEFERLPLAGVAVVTDGRAAAVEEVRTQLERAFPGSSAETGRDLYADESQQLHDTEHLADVALVVTLLIAGCSLAVSVAGGLVERKRPFALLRLTGVRLRELDRVVLAEAAAPLLVVSGVSVALGFAVDALLVKLVGGRQTFQFPPVGYWVSLGAGLACALAIVAATLPLLDRVTSLETARFE
jgi:predicted lysophospholipase L1 biosynthesis ABC-type transport system permease subunit